MTLLSRATSNVWLDSTQTADWVNTASAGVRLYPTATTELRLAAEGTVYSESREANHVKGDVGVMQVISRSGGLARTFIEFRWVEQRYTEDGQILDSRTLAGAFAWTSDPRRSPSFRLGTRAHAMEYRNATYANHWQAEIYAGLNFTALGQNSFDLEAGAGLVGLRALDVPFRVVIISQPEAYLIDTGLTTVYVSPRWSRPIGPKSGISLRYTLRYPTRGRDMVVYGFSSGYLSPWANAFYGPDLALNFKTYLIRPLTVDVGLTYAGHTYLHILNDVTSTRLRFESRFDHLALAAVTTRVPLRFMSPSQLDAVVIMQYAANDSSLDYYNYTEASVAVGLTWSL